MQHLIVRLILIFTKLPGTWMSGCCVTTILKLSSSSILYLPHRLPPAIQPCRMVCILMSRLQSPRPLRRSTPCKGFIRTLPSRPCFQPQRWEQEGQQEEEEEELCLFLRN